MRILHFVLFPYSATCIQDVWNKDCFIEKIVQEFLPEKERFTIKNVCLHVPILL